MNTDTLEALAENPGLDHVLSQHRATRPKRTHADAIRYSWRRLHNVLMLAGGDTLALTLALLAAGAVRLWWFGEPLIPAWSWYILPVWWGGTTLMHLLPSWGLGPVEELRRLTALLFFVFASAAVVLFLSQQADSVSRLTLTLGLCISLLTVPLIRLRVKRLLIAFGLWGVPTVIYGAGQTGTEVVRFLQKEKGLGYTPVGVFDDDPALQNKRFEDVRVLGGTNLVVSQASVAILAMPSISRTRLIELLEGPLSHYRTVLVIPDLFDAPSLWVRPRDLNGMLGLEINSNLESPFARFTKRAVDVALVVAFAPYWLLLCAILALLIWLEDGEHPLFLQERVGRQGRVFKTWKFRTMVPNAEEVLRQKLVEDALLRKEWETFYKLKNDPRITRVGGFLRHFSLDELPQLVNVLRGEMSLVGPRPLPPYHHEELSSRVRDLRSRVRPGVTGLWQVSGRSDAGTEGMEQWDPYYVRNWSLWLDIVILIRTARTVIGGSGAY